MSNLATKNLQSMGITLPAAAKPAANYVSYVKSGNQVIISGQIPMINGQIADSSKGRVGESTTVEEAAATARLCGLNILAQLKEACGGSLDNVKQCVRLGVFVNSAEDFTAHPVVANGVSDLMVEVFGSDVGSHARAAVGVNQLPFGVSVEVEALFEI